MAQRNTAIRGIQIRDGEVGLAQLTAAVGVSLGKAGTALQTYSNTFLLETDTPASYTSQGLKGVRVNVGETALEFYTITDAVGILEAAVAVEDIAPESAEKVYTLATRAVAASVQVYLNGLLQEEGAGHDYVVSEAGSPLKTVITFADFIEMDDIVIVHSITMA